MKIIKKPYDVEKEIKTIQKAMRRRKQKNRKFQTLTSRPHELKKLKTDLKNKMNALKQIITKKLKR